MSWFRKIFSKKNEVKTYEGKFDDVDIDNLFESLKTTSIKIQRQEKYLEDVQALESPLSSFLSLDENTQKSLKNYATQYKDITDEQRGLQTRLVKNNPALYRISIYEQEVPTLLIELKQVQNLVKTFRNNIYYLRDEKEELIQDRVMLIRGYDYLRKFSIVFAVLLALCLLLIFTMMQVLREDIWIYMSAVCGVFIIFVPTLLLTKEKLEKEMTRNEILQKRAAKYIKKYQIHYFQQKNYLQYEFSKLGVDSIKKLENYYDKYLTYKAYEVKYNRNIQTMQISQQKIQEILSDHKLPTEDSIVIEEWLFNPHKIEESKMLVREIEPIKVQIKTLKEYEEDVYKQLIAYAEMDEYKDIVAKKLDEHYEWLNERLDKEKAVNYNKK
ncbi:MAG: hypothetical protein BEN19_04180 [Epulopiscium sp. Nuni2H_MBin003]|nr:MAG: hypothetical protein BEN19_04180 [Epulopiscium sp. Nuni2H_MBin003]